MTLIEGGFSRLAKLQSFNPIDVSIAAVYLTMPQLRYANSLSEKTPELPKQQSVIHTHDI